MPSSEFNVAVAAMAIAVIAFFVACGQFLQQIFGTAEGYRRCQNSVIGGWYDYVHLRWRWSEFRFETIVVTPHFIIEDISLTADFSRSLSRKPQTWTSSPTIPVTGSRLSRKWTKTPELLKGSRNTNPDIVTWSALLGTIHDMQVRQFMNGFEADTWLGSIKSFHASEFRVPRGDVEISGVAIRLMRHSWDLMPPDVSRPLATSNVGTIIALAHRMGMSWRDLRPTEGRMRAEGYGQSLSATNVKGLGIVLQYTKEDSLLPQSLEEVHAMLRIPSRDADKLGCGIIPGYEALSTWDLHLTGDRQEADPSLDMVEFALRGMRVDPGAIKTVLASMDSLHIFHRLTAFTDVQGFWSDWLPLDGSCITTLISPMRTSLIPMVEAYEPAVVWRHHLQMKLPKDPAGLSRQQHSILNHFDLWAAEYPDHFFQWTRLFGNQPRHMEYRTFLKRIWDSTTEYFLELNKRHGLKDNEDDPRRARRLGFYSQLIASHVTVCASSLKEAEANLAEDGTRHDHASVGAKLDSEIFAERGFIYIDNIPKIVEQMKKRGFENGNEVEDAYWTLLLRGQAWTQATVRLGADAPAPIPSYYYNSTTPVYII